MNVNKVFHLTKRSCYTKNVFQKIGVRPLMHIGVLIHKSMQSNMFLGNLDYITFY